MLDTYFVFKVSIVKDTYYVVTHFPSSIFLSFTHHQIFNSIILDKECILALENIVCSQPLDLGGLQTRIVISVAVQQVNCIINMSSYDHYLYL